MTETFTKRLTEEARNAGIKRLALHIEEQETRTLNVYEGRPEKSTLSRESAVHIEGEYNGHRGCAYTESLDFSVIPSLLDHVMQTAEYDRVPFLPKEISVFPSAYAAAEEPASLTDRLIEAEKEAHACDRRVESVRKCAFSSTFRRVALQNEKGQRMDDPMRYFGACMDVVARDGANFQTATARVLTGRGDIDLGQLAKDAAVEAVAMLSASSPKSGACPVVLRSDVFCELLSAFLPTFYADKVQTGMSLLRGRLEDGIANGTVNLWEDPTPAGGVVVRRFDDEGTTTRKKPIIENGVLKTYLHNRKTAQHDAVASTGNGFKHLYKENVAVASTNVVLQPGGAELPDLVRSAGSGVIVTHCDGVFAGTNVFSGDFSVLSKGFLIENGKISRPINQFTIGGNFFTLLRDIVGLGNDCGTTFQASNFVKAPSILVKSLLISGAAEGKP